MDWPTFQVALITAIASESIVVGVVTFDAHDMLPALFGVHDVLLQVVVQLLECQLCCSARRIYISLHRNSKAVG